MGKPTVKIGDIVTCRRTEEAYYSGRAGNAPCFFRPGDVGIVVSLDTSCVERSTTSSRVEFFAQGNQEQVYLMTTNDIHPCYIHPWSVALDNSNIVKI